MNKYCDEECEERGAICDFCKHYKDDGDRSKLGGFEGEGVCLVKNIRVDALDMCEDDFCCFNVKE